MTKYGTGHVFLFLTGEQTTEESAAHGDWENSGWVDPRWNRYEFYDNRNYVRPLVSLDEDDPDLGEEIRDALSQYLPGGPEVDVSPNGYGVVSTLYGRDSDNPYDREGSYTYAIHAKLKYYNGEEYVEEPFDMAPYLTEEG